MDMQNIPIPTIHLFPVLEAQLISFLRTLKPEDWNKPTIASLWTIKDIAAHLLDGNIRVLSMIRDNYFGTASANIDSNDELVAYLNGLNAQWVNAMKRMSPGVLITWLEITGKQYNQQMAALDPFAPAMFAVSWAGEKTSINWFHIAREYTERWHHQQQIRDALGNMDIMSKELYYPVLDTFMMALPYAYRNTAAARDTVVQISVSGEAGGDWFITKKETWELSKTNYVTVSAQVSIIGTVAWKLFTKSWRKKEVMDFVTLDGDTALGEPVLDMVSVMA